jgi:hypothetical protein
MVYPYALSRWSYGDHLEHYGIKGQQWNVRRFQNEDGTLTEEGKLRYGVGNRTEKDEIKTRPKETQEARDKSYKVLKKVLAITAGVTVAAALAYGGYKAHKFISPLMNRTIKTGATISRVTSDPTDSFSRAFYAADNAKDAVKYKGMLARERIRQVQNRNHNLFHNPIRVKEGGKNVFYGRQGPPVKEAVYEVTGRANGKIKIAGDSAGKKAYEHLMKNDPAFRKIVEEKKLGTVSIPTELKGDVNSPMNQYKLFNRSLVDHYDQQQELTNKFFAELKKRGFGGVVDVNDRDFTVYKSKAKIIFDVDKIRKTGVKEMNLESIEPYKKQVQKIMSRENRRRSILSKTLKSLKRIMYGGTALSGLTGVSLAGSKAEDNRLIRDYRKEHPNSKMTDRGILEMLRNQS